MKNTHTLYIQYHIFIYKGSLGIYNMILSLPHTLINIFIKGSASVELCFSVITSLSF